MNILKASLKQIFGAKYESAVKSIIVCLILFLAVHNAGIHMEIAASVLFLTAVALSAAIMWQTLHSSENADRMAGMFMLPFSNREMTFSFVLAFAGYTLLTKTFPVLALFFAVHEWSALQIAMALLCACNGCCAAAACYTMTNEGAHHNAAVHHNATAHHNATVRHNATAYHYATVHHNAALLHRKRKWIAIAVLWYVGMSLSIFFVRDVIVLALIVLVSLFLSFMRLLTADVYVFYHPASAKSLIRRTKGTGSILLYLLRYLITNKNYLMNTAGLCVVGGILPRLLGQFEGLNVMLLGFAILCLNTPICILLSCDPGLEQAVRVLPGQAGHFGIRYSFFIFAVNMAVNSVYLVGWQILYSGVGGMEIMAAALISLQSAILSVLLEWFRSIRNWKIESDLWRHPRKYIVPLIMLPVAGFIGMWPESIWVLLCIVLAETLSLSFITRRI